jgi:hypothetical protein
MKKNLIIAAVVVLSIGAYNSFAQGTFSATVANTNNIVTFSLMPNVTTSTGFSDIEFFLVSPASSPAYSWGTVTANTTNFPGMTATSVPGSGSWEIVHNDPGYPISGFNVDHFIYTAPAPITTTTSYTGGTPYQLISVPLIGAPPNTVSFTFLDIEPSEYVYLAITDQNGADLRPASPSNYFYPATATISATTYPGTGGATNTAYYMALPNVPVPIKFINFNAIPQDNNAVLDWTVANEGTTSDYYKVERSTDDITFTAIDSVPVTDPEAASNTYSYVDPNISSIPSSSGALYYRIEEFDQTGKVNYSTTQNIPLEANSLAAKVFPNPAKNSATLTFNLDVDKVVPVDIASADGKIVQTLQLQGVKGINTQLIDLSSFSAGNYLLKLNTGSGIKTIGLVKTN